MKLNFLRLMVTASLLMFAGAAQAIISCSVSSSGFTAAYIPANAGTNITQSSFTVTCTRGLPVDPTTETYSVKVNNGQNAKGIGNHAILNGSNLISYDLYIDSGCATQWKGGASLPIGGSMTLSGLTPTSVTTSYWGCIPAGQNGLATGTYSDTVSMTLTHTNSIIPTNNTFPVSIFSPAVCNITTTPGNVSFGTYNALGAAVNASASFGATCTSTLPYTISLDANSGVVSGLQYSLLLRNTNSGGTNTFSSSGSGVEQTFFINGSMAAGQAGTCATGSCLGSDTRTLTITY